MYVVSLWEEIDRPESDRLAWPTAPVLHQSLDSSDCLGFQDYTLEYARPFSGRGMTEVIRMLIDTSTYIILEYRRQEMRNDWLWFVAKRLPQVVCIPVRTFLCLRFLFWEASSADGRRPHLEQNLEISYEVRSYGISFLKS